jgi:ABC-2 type transport system permease protein
VLKAVSAIVPMLIGLYGFGFAFAGVVLLMREANTLVDTSAFIVQVFSGTDFPVTVLPKWLLPIALILPLTYGLDAARGLLLKTNTLLSIGAEVILLIVFMFIMLWLGSWIFYRVERRVRTLGTLGQH